MDARCTPTDGRVADPRSEVAEDPRGVDRPRPAEAVDLDRGEPLEELLRAAGRPQRAPARDPQPSPPASCACGVPARRRHLVAGAEQVLRPVQPQPHDAFDHLVVLRLVQMHVLDRERSRARGRRRRTRCTRRRCRRRSTQLDVNAESRHLRAAAVMFMSPSCVRATFRITRDGVNGFARAPRRRVLDQRRRAAAPASRASWRSSPSAARRAGTRAPGLEPLPRRRRRARSRCSCSGSSFAAWRCSYE